MRKYMFSLICLLGALAMAAPSANAQALQNLLEIARALSPGGNTIGGPGIFAFQPNQRVNVVDLSSSPDSVCASVLIVSGTVDILVKDAAGTVIEGSIANATPGPGGITAGATACADGVGLVEVLCSSNSTEPCRGAWRADKK